MPLLLESLNHSDGATNVECQVSLNGLRGAHQCTSPAVLTAVETLKDACRAELSGADSVGGHLGMVVEKRPVIVVEPIATEVTA